MLRYGMTVLQAAAYRVMSPHQLLKWSKMLVVNGKLMLASVVENKCTCHVQQVIHKDKCKRKKGTLEQSPYGSCFSRLVRWKSHFHQPELFSMPEIQRLDREKQDCLLRGNAAFLTDSKSPLPLSLLGVTPCPIPWGMT